jgi:uncharacterized protein YukE
VELLTPADVKRWDPDAIHAVFETADERAGTLQRLGDSLQQVHRTLSDWHGEAGDAFRVDLGKTRHDIEKDGQESKQVAAAVTRAEADVRGCKAELDGIERAADGCGWTITPDWRIDVGDTEIGLDRFALAAEQQILQDDLNACKVHAHSADHELATAVRGAVGDIALDATGHQPNGAPTPQGPSGRPGGGPPKSWQDMLLPAGAAGAEPGGGPSRGAPAPARAGGTASSLEDLMLGRGKPSQPGDQQPQPGSLPDLLSRLSQPGVPGGAPAPRLNPADVQSFKAMARQSMVRDGVPPDQIEARLDEIVGRTQQWMDNGMANYVAPEPQRPPPPGFAEGFGDSWFAAEQGIKNLFGQGGPGAPGVAESWVKMLQGMTQTVQNPIGAMFGEYQHALDSPSAAYYLGGKTADAAVTLPGLMFGPEAAGAGELGELDAYAGLTHPPNLPIGFDNPTSYHPWSESAAQDLFSAFGHGEPTASLNQHLSDMVTHYVGDNADRVVLGKWDGQQGGYIGEARGNGGIYFDTGDPTWEALAYGLPKSVEQELVWPVNEQFLRTQMENQVGRIDYVLDHGEYESLEDMAEDRATSYSASEVNFLNEAASAYGYERVGDSWVYVGGGP